MTLRRFLYLLFFVFECIRLLLVLVSLSESGGGASAGSAFAAPQSLFVLMALFLWLDPDAFSMYRPLLAGGKLVSAVSLFVWVSSSIRGMTGIFSMNTVDSLVALVIPSIVAIADLVTGSVLSFSVTRAYFHKTREN